MSLKALTDGVGQPPCEPGFVLGKGRLKNKFCGTCRKGMMMPVSHVRALTPALAQALSASSKGGGVWSSAVLSGQHVLFRRLNHAKGCRGIALALFYRPPPELGWEPVPTEWLSPQQDTMQIVLAHGTLVPSKALTQAYGTQLQDRAEESREQLRVIECLQYGILPPVGMLPLAPASMPTTATAAAGSSSPSKRRISEGGMEGATRSSSHKRSGNGVSSSSSSSDDGGSASFNSGSFNSSAGSFNSCSFNSSRLNSGSLVLDLAALVPPTALHGAPAPAVAHGAAASVQLYAGHLLSSFLPSAMVSPAASPDVRVPPVAHGAAACVQPYSGQLLSSFVPSAMEASNAEAAAEEAQTASKVAAIVAKVEEADMAAKAVVDSRSEPSLAPPVSQHATHPSASVELAVKQAAQQPHPILQAAELAAHQAAQQLHPILQAAELATQQEVIAQRNVQRTHAVVQSTMAVAETVREAAASPTAEDSSLLPSPPTSPPESLGDYWRLPTNGGDPALPIARHPLTLRFFPPTAEAAWRAEHSQSVRDVGLYLVCPLTLFYFAMGLGQANPAVQLWLLAWSIGWLPASLLLHWLREQDGGKHRAVALPLRQTVARLLDWGALSLCVLPQLALTLRTRLSDWGGPHGQLNGSDGSTGRNGDVRNGSLDSHGLVDGNGPLDSNGLLNGNGLLDPLDGDPFGGAGSMGRVLANWWFAHFFLHANCTEPALLLLAVALSAALISLQAPISVVPFQERLMVYKGFLGGQLSGYVFQRHLRCSYFHEQRLSGSRRAKLTGAATPASTSPSSISATRSEPAEAGADLTPSFAYWTQQESRMDPLTLCFASSVLEARYRNFCFDQTAKAALDCTYVTDIVFQLLDFIGGQATLLDILRVVILQAVPLVGRAVVRRRGDQQQEKEFFRHAYFAWMLLLLIAKLLLPSAAGGSNVETWYFLAPFFLRLQGPRRIPLCWTMGMTAIVLSKVSPCRTWRGDQSADAAAMRDAVVAAEMVAYSFDYMLRLRFLRAQARNDEERSDHMR